MTRKHICRPCEIKKKEICIQQTGDCRLIDICDITLVEWSKELKEKLKMFPETALNTQVPLCKHCGQQISVEEYTEDQICAMYIAGGIDKECFDEVMRESWI
jgi:hypothetical protein